MQGHERHDMTANPDNLGHGIPPAGFRLPPETVVGGVRLLVSDLTRSIGYYERVLGLRLGSRSADRAVLTAQDDDRVLVELETRPGVRPVARRATLGLYHFAILLPNRPALGRFLAHLSAIGVAAGMSDHLVSEAIYLTDPDGLGIEVYADRPRSEWRYRGHQLVMATEPLGARDLIAAGGGEPWAGMPAGTVIGHVHLHVADLVVAEAFYHAALGFDKVVWEYPGALFLSAGGYHHHLGTNTWSAGPPPADNQARLLSWDVVVPTGHDAQAAARSLASAGYPIELREGAWIAEDPWGTPLRLVVGCSSDAEAHEPHGKNHKPHEPHGKNHKRTA
jgi:catechol 2,3-dioxygenase